MSNIDNILERRNLFIEYFHKRRENAINDIEEKIHEFSEIDFKIISLETYLDNLKYKLSTSSNNEKLNKDIQEQENLLKKYNSDKEKVLKEICELFNYCPDYFMNKK